MPGQDATFLAHPVDPIRIVPLQLPDELAAPTAAPAATPALTYRGGPLLAAVEVFTVFWGAGWAQAPAAGLIDQINGSFDFVLTSALIDELDGYSVTGYQIVPRHVYLPPGVVAVQGGSRSCSSFCGYHSNVGNIFYAVMPYPGCSGCTGNLQPFDALTSTSSHELAEAITDTIPGQGWHDDQNGEIGDICAWQTKHLGNYTVQLLWSKQAGQCV